MTNTAPGPLRASISFAFSSVDTTELELAAGDRFNRYLRDAINKTAGKANTRIKRMLFAELHMIQANRRKRIFINRASEQNPSASIKIGSMPWWAVEVGAADKPPMGVDTVSPLGTKNWPHGFIATGKSAGRQAWQRRHQPWKPVSQKYRYGANRKGASRFATEARNRAWDKIESVSDKEQRRIRWAKQKSILERIPGIAPAEAWRAMPKAESELTSFIGSDLPKQVDSQLSRIFKEGSK